MPKVLPQLAERIRAEARRQLFTQGFHSLTVRSVAAGCGIATGTLYNYYASKQQLVAALVLEDWLPLRERMEAFCTDAAAPLDCCRVIYDALLAFEQQYAPVFSQASAAKLAATDFAFQHKKLRAQLAALLHGPCCHAAGERSPAMAKGNSLSPEFLADFLAEALLAWSRESRPFADLEPILCRVL